MMNKIIKNKFATKIVLIILVIGLVPTVLNSIFYYFSSSSIVKENERESSQQIVRQAADYLSFTFSVGSDMADLIYSNRNIQEIVKQDLRGQTTFLEREENNEFMSSYLNSHVYASTFVRMIYIIKEEGKSWGSGTFSERKLSTFTLDEWDWVKRAKEKDGELVWEGIQLDRLSGAGEKMELVLPISRTMNDFEDLDNIAYIQVLLDGREIIEKMHQIKLGETGRFFVVNQQGKIMIDPKTENINKRIANRILADYILNSNQVEFEFEEDGLNYYGVKQPLSNGWTMVGVVPIHEITGELVNMQYISILTSIILVFFVVVIGFIVANQTTQPVKVLTNQMKLVGKGNFNARTSVQTTDEIGMMSRQFNEMIQQIELLMDQVKQEQINKKEAEIRAVKHRINPHFLYNSLSTIRWLVQFNQTERANSALLALTRLLEANMGKKGTFVKVTEEIDFVEKYVKLLQIRYDQCFHLHVDLDEEVEDFLIPQMLLQPIVENAIFHGIVPTTREGAIHIIGRKLVNGVELTIKDDGIGIKPERLIQIQNNPNNNGIGLLHVYDSVHLYYSPDSTIEIDSSSDGTQVKLVLKPNNEGEMYV